MTYPVDTTAAPAKKPGPRLSLSIIVIIIGTIVGIAGLVVVISKVADEFQGPIHHVGDAPYTEHLAKGTFELFAGVTSDTVTTPLQGPNGITGLQVTAPDGTTLPINSNPADETLGRSSIEFLAIASFKTPAAGDYKIEVAGDQGEPFVIKSSFGDVAKRAGGWLAMMGAGILIGFIGVVMLIVGIVRRSRAKRPAFVGGYAPAGSAPGYPPVGTVSTPPVAPGSPPPGWYPDPQIPGTNRYWDGTRWTDQTQTP
jgi:hypothetical protein